MQNFSNYLQSKALSEATINAYTSSMAHYFSMYQEVSTENVYLYRQQCLQFHKPMTVNLRLNAIRKWAKYKGIEIEIGHWLFLLDRTNNINCTLVRAYIKNIYS